MDDKFSNIGPSYFNQLRFEIDEGKAEKEDVELTMEYYTYCFENHLDIPHDLFALINDIFKRYSKHKFMDGALAKAFGFTGKQGDRKLERRDEDLSRDVAYYYLSGMSLTNAKQKVREETGLGKTVLEDAWKKFKQTGIIRVRLEKLIDGKDFTEKQKLLAEKILAKQRKEIQSLINSSGN